MFREKCSRRGEKILFFSLFRRSEKVTFVDNQSTIRS